MKTLTKLALVLSVVFFVSCEKSQSLQEYYVDNQDNSNFLSLDIPTSLLLASSTEMDAEQRETLNSIKKVNLLAFPSKADNQTEYEEEKTKLSRILEDDKFQVLMKFNQNSTNAKVMYLGDEEAIDEVIIFGEAYDKGFGVARILGNDMDPEKILMLIQSMEKNMVNFGGLGDFAKDFEAQH